jgi:hypothetical protein
VQSYTQKRLVGLMSNNNSTKFKYHKDGTLPTNGEIFVFGSNLAGLHGGGAARVAHEKFGAIYGEGAGWYNQSFAIPTKDKQILTLPLDVIEGYIKLFFEIVVSENPDYKQGFFITRIGCGLAGYTDSQIAPMFKDFDDLNCSFAEEWKPYLE